MIIYRYMLLCVLIGFVDDEDYHENACLQARKWEGGELELPPSLFRPTNTIITKIIAPIPKRISPTLGWKISQAIAVARIQRGMEIKTAARNIANPRIPEMIPPTKGMKPIRLTMGEKKRQIPKTMQTKESILITLVKHYDFQTALSNISSLLTFSQATSRMSSMGLRSSAQHADMRQQQQSGILLVSLLVPSYCAMSKLEKVGPADLATKEMGPVGHNTQ